MNCSLFDLTGKNILITGSSRGLGWAMALGIAEAGGCVIINGTQTAAVEQRVAELRAAGHAAFGLPFNIRSSDEIEAAVTRLELEQGPLDVLINNAGINRRGSLEEISEAEFQEVIDVNLTSMWRVSRVTVRGMIERGRGKIINLASLMSWAGRPTTGAYTASKGGVALLTKAMAVEWAQHNIQANAIAPGYFLSDMTQRLADDPAFDQWVRMRAPARRWGSPAELAGPAVFLASEASSYVNGQVIFVDGGWSSNI